MKRSLFILIIVLGSCFLASCRAQRHTHNAATRVQTDEIGVELRRVDSLWSSIAERLNCKIDFYPIEYGPGKPATDSTCPAAPSTTMPANSQFPPQGVCAGVGGMGAALRQAHGAVKSIEFTMERDAQTAAATQVDSTYYNNSAAEETLQEEKASEIKHDNGTVAIVSVVGALVVLAALLIVIKKVLKK